MGFIRGFFARVYPERAKRNEGPRMTTHCHPELVKGSLCYVMGFFAIAQNDSRKTQNDISGHPELVEGSLLSDA